MQGHFLLHVRKTQADVVTQRELESLLSDPIDIVKDAHLEAEAHAQMYDGADAPADQHRQAASASTIIAARRSTRRQIIESSRYLTRVAT